MIFAHFSVFPRLCSALAEIPQIYNLEPASLRKIAFTHFTSAFYSAFALHHSETFIKKSFIIKVLYNKGFGLAYELACVNERLFT